jgi:quercetin dioxygenase-like cupin family protein
MQFLCGTNLDRLSCRNDPRTMRRFNVQSIFATSWRRLAVALALTAALLVGAAGLTSAQDSATPAATPAAAVREVLVESSPSDADGQVMQLVRYDIPAGIILPEHTHPGTQQAYIESGVLTYHVISGGSIPVTRADGSTEQLGPGESTELHPGDSVVEVPGVVHYGENLGTETVIILAADLLDPDQPASVLYTPEASPVATPAG